jgi:aldose 1-epimerase
MDGYLKAPNYFGATVGRYANRIAKGRFTLDGKVYQLPINDGPNALHGGLKGFDKRLWTIAKVDSGAKSASVTLTYTSADGEEGYPGTMQVSATFTLTESDELQVTYRATTDKPTIVNLTNHSYFNLAGQASGISATDAVLTMPAASYTPVDATLIPTGELRPVAGTPFDFRTPRRIADRLRDGRDEQMRIGRGYDHNFVISRAPETAVHMLARVADPGSGRVMELLSNQPGVQFYTGNFLDGTATGKAGVIYRQGDAICLEPQVFPDTPNQPKFGSARLDPGQTYENRIVYRFSVRR